MTKQKCLPLLRCFQPLWPRQQWHSKCITEAMTVTATVDLVDAAAGIAGAAIGTAAAIATAPFRDSYAYDNGYGYDNGYTRRNRFVCQPGTWFRGEDGRRHLCQ